MDMSGLIVTLNSYLQILSIFTVLFIIHGVFLCFTFGQLVYSNRTSLGIHSPLNKLGLPKIGMGDNGFLRKQHRDM